MTEPTQVSTKIMAAISCGAVFMGGQHLHRQRPELHGESHRGRERRPHAVVLWLLFYSGAILIPLFIVMTFIFFRG